MGGYVRIMMSKLWWVFADREAHDRCFRKASQHDADMVEYALGKLERSREHASTPRLYIHKFNAHV